MCLRLLVASMLASVCFLSLPAKAEIMTPEAMLEAFFKEDTVNPERFAPVFLTKVPAADVARIISGMKQDHGVLLAVVPSGDDFLLRFERAEVFARITLDDENRVVGLWFGPPLPYGDVGSQVAAIEALPGRTSLLVLTNGKPVAEHEAETPLAVGSAAKLAILLAVKQAVAEGRLNWADVVDLDPAWKSLPSGQLQDWPDGTPLTIATLTNLMISVSDNTATDALIRIVEREAVEAVSPRNAPFLTTREAFILKTREHAGLREEWRSGDVTVRRAMLDRIADEPVPPASALSPAITYEVEWFMTARELCSLLDATANLPSVSINPGPADRRDWRSVAYKGGSEIGVLNLSSRVVGENGQVHCVVASWNGDGPLNEDDLLTPYRGLVGRLAKQSE